MPFLKAANLSHRFEDDFGRLVLNQIDLSVPEGAFVALVGTSGIGKSTLLQILGGLIPPTEGRITLNDRPLSQTHYSIGIVFQRDNLFPWRTVRENVALPLELQQVAAGEIQQRVAEMLALVGLRESADFYPAQLSGGMAQRVALARALIHRPDLLLLDEPFGALDALTREKMGQELLRIWQARPTTVVMVTHSIPEAVFLADEVLVMNGTNGRKDYPATISHHIPIGIPRPRAFAIQTDPEFLNCVARVREALSN
ncbi:MAG: ABC transporter ATP-binding protein [Ardenticatenaceae bacterium]|nr:ABC transporter ATP-binding protein [Ardenticatenaceae bacterium]